MRPRTRRSRFSSTLLANDTDVDMGDSKTLVSVQGAQHGTVSLNSSGDVVFAADANYSGPASFTYTMKDAAGATSTATASVNVAAVNDAPVAAADTVNATEDTPVTILASTLLANDTDVDMGDSKTLVSVQGAQHGTVSLNSSGDVVFAADANYSGPASFTNTMKDAAGATSTATVSVNVAAVADAPTLTLAPATGNEDAAIALSIGAALTDTDGSESLVSLVVSA